MFPCMCLNHGHGAISRHRVHHRLSRRTHALAAIATWLPWQAKREASLATKGKERRHPAPGAAARRGLTVVKIIKREMNQITMKLTKLEI